MDDAELHSAGAIVRRSSPFDQLPVHSNCQELSAEFLQKWAIPYYMDIGSYGDDQWVEKIKIVKEEINRDICLLLLGDFNWRTRLVGTYFAAVKGYEELIPVIGTHLLQSKLCCVGHVYTLVLAFFNSKECLQYLHNYLEYYLTKPGLYFDQYDVMRAVMYLDVQNNTDMTTKYLPLWKAFMEERRQLERVQAEKLIAQLPGLGVTGEVANTLQKRAAEVEETTIDLSTEYYTRQVQILKTLAENH